MIPQTRSLFKIEQIMQQDIDKFDLTLDLINKTSANIFLTGKAGTGKTTFLARFFIKTKFFC